jgi:hypothetical protein
VAVRRSIQAMIHMVVNEPTLRFADRLLDRMKLLCELDAAATFIEHLDDAPHVPLRTLEALDDVGVGSMNVCLRHSGSVSYRGGYAKPASSEPIRQTECGAARFTPLLGTIPGVSILRVASQKRSATLTREIE